MSQNKKTFLISIIFGLITLTIIGFIILPLLRGIKKNSGELSVVKRDLFISQGKAGGLEQIKETYEGLKPDLERIEKLFVDSKVPVDLIQFWEKTAIDSGISIEISPSSLKTIGEDPWNSMGFQISLIGPFPSFLKFLEKTENAPYLIEVQSLTVKKLTEGELGLVKYKQFSLDDVKITLLTKVYTK